jgi:hypothetical protein
VSRITEKSAMNKDTDQTISPWAGAAGGESVALAVAPRRLGAGSDDRAGAGGPTLWFSTSTYRHGREPRRPWLDQYVSSPKAVKTVLIGGVKLVDDCAPSAQAAIERWWRVLPARP